MFTHVSGWNRNGRVILTRADPCQVGWFFAYFGFRKPAGHFLISTFIKWNQFYYAIYCFVSNKQTIHKLQKTNNAIKEGPYKPTKWLKVKVQKQSTKQWIVTLNARITKMFKIFWKQEGWLVVLRLNVPVNNFSVMSGRSHRFLGN